MQEHKPLTHRGIEIVLPEVPGAPVTWTHDESNTHGFARKVEGAICQISHFLGPDPECRVCLGTGADDYTALVYVPCRVCYPEAKE
ncbi:hypothetical protein [Paracoccus aminophilus]|uniref:hypothetical protein n=1 Tax=Paracoccus aminophilus TaxID=34003 RepID=UPI00040947F6|nr:hypothetical protein [Paracoccus aminophilus]